MSSFSGESYWTGLPSAIIIDISALIHHLDEILYPPKEFWSSFYSLSISPAPWRFTLICTKNNPAIDCLTPKQILWSSCFSVRETHEVRGSLYSNHIDQTIRNSSYFQTAIYPRFRSETGCDTSYQTWTRVIQSMCSSQRRDRWHRVSFYADFDRIWEVGSQPQDRGPLISGQNRPRTTHDMCKVCTQCITFGSGSVLLNIDITTKSPMCPPPAIRESTCMTVCKRLDSLIGMSPW